MSLSEKLMGADAEVLSALHVVVSIGVIGIH